MLVSHEGLLKADLRIAEWRKLVVKQKRRIATLQREGHDAGGSITLLRGLEASLRSMCDSRGAIARKLERR